MARELEPIVKKLTEEGNIVYSISKINTFNQCEYEYFNTYVKGNRGIDNVYSIAGKNIHNDLEAVYSGETVDLQQSLQKTLDELEMLNITFINDKIRDSWIADMSHFCKNFQRQDSGIFLTEEGFIFEIMPKVYIQGYIDLKEKHEDDSISIYDFKTSSRFDKKKLVEAGRQLVLYGMALQDKYKINTIAWHMLKYIYVCWKLKNGKTNRKMCNRSKWVKEIGTDKMVSGKITKSVLKKDLEALGYQEFEIDLMLSEAISKNNISNLPKKVQDKYWLEDCVLEYDFSIDTKDELTQYIKNTHERIIAKDSTNEPEWTPKNIEEDNFYCSNLCGHRKGCKYLMEYYEKLKLGETDKDKEWEDLFA